MLFMRGPGLPVLVPSLPEFQEITERDGGSDRHRSECVLDLLVVVAVDGLVHRLDDRHRRIEVGPNDLAIGPVLHRADRPTRVEIDAVGASNEDRSTNDRVAADFLLHLLA